MFSTGILIIPTGHIEDVITVVESAEQAGFDFCLLADEGFTYDVYVLMTAILANTKRMRVAPITNPYSRHPAVTAVALASANTLAPGRVFLNIVPGGSLVLGPMNLIQKKPVSACREMIQIVRALLSGEKSVVNGSVFQLSDAQLQIPSAPIDIWVMGRGPKMVRLSGEMADVTVVTSRLGVNFTIEQASAGAEIGGRPLKLAHLGIMAFNQDIMDRMRPHYTYVIPDSPQQLWDELGVSPEWVAELKRTREVDGIEAATQLITDDILRQVMVAGTPHECVQDISGLAEEWHYDYFILPVMSLDLEYALPVIEESARIYALAQAKTKEE